MKTCGKHREMLMLDVHGEAVEDGSAWERHLSECPDCRDERQRLLTMVHRVHEACRFPEPCPMETLALRSSISRTIDRERHRQGPRPRFLGITLPPLPALAAACLLVVAFGWLGFRELHWSTPTQTTAHLEPEERLIVKDLDLLKEMDLLQDIEVIQKLVQVVDHEDKEATL